ncbi:MAG: PIN-like domain-containing protein, partial [Alphaproteobacteria bacterium]
MRDRFPWYFLDQTDYDAAWDKGILTVDTNVMLDLYRYNKSTRDALLAALESFNGRFWISHQTAKEFVKNRRVVITDMENDFDKAKKHVEEVEKAMSTAVNAIRGCRVVPKELIENFEKDIQKACGDIRAKIDKERTVIPDYEKNDDVVQRLETALAGCGKTQCYGPYPLESRL